MRSLARGTAVTGGGRTSDLGAAHGGRTGTAHCKRGPIGLMLHPEAGAGYGVLAGLTPEPIFLTRHIASWMMKARARAHSFLVDEVGAAGMSGSPVFVRETGVFRLLGVYTGALFPDRQQTGHPQDAYSGLGEIVPFGARSVFQH